MSIVTSSCYSVPWMWGVLSADTLSAAARRKTMVGADFMLRALSVC